ncbi:amidohydrolase [Pseudooceanicola sp. HF7]|uniref:amidohydrolase n=1 Tax=Pseudooceanicola sp. HF7 TaxID=2721560 RepID=UPI0014316CB7|nr:amidohydrolase [Pseudooceanicola sp. HF7]NIZ10614.1 amidohydrolase [Pseudooceanicola sp. HF7]
MTHNIDTLIDGVSEQVIEWRRHLHAHPELSFEEYETSKFIVQSLEGIGGIEISHPSGTSVVGRLIGSKPGPVIAIRADFDALPIQEDTGLPFASKTDNKMHACGHDGHTSILLGTAAVLAAMKDDLAGEIRFLFQHGEEAPPGGARGMIEGGALDGVDRIIGLHLWSPIEIGTVQINPTYVMAACDVFRIEIKGNGGHIGDPHTSIDTIAIGAQIVDNLQHIVARNVDPIHSAIVGVTNFNAGVAIAVIPPSAVLTGGTNVFDPNVRDLLEKRIGEIAHGICATHGARCEYEYTRVYDTVVNDPDTAAIVDGVAAKLFGRENVKDLPPIMPGEDFAFFAQQKPSCFVLLGAGNKEKGIIAPHHDPKFDIDEDSLAMGTRLFVNAAIELLEQTKPGG